MTNDQKEAQRPAFEAWYKASGRNQAWHYSRRGGVYYVRATEFAFDAWIASKADIQVTEETARPLSEWYEDLGDVLWWKFPVEEAPYVGSPTCLGQTVEVHNHAGMLSRFNVGGWPGYHTHWTRLPAIPKEPAPSTGDDKGAGNV